MASKLLLFLFIVVILNILFKQNVYAGGCCGGQGCSSIQTCVNDGGCSWPYNATGVCVNTNYETCTNSSQCPGGETCINNLCYGSGGPPAPTVHDGCSPYGLILKCGPIDPSALGCRLSQGGCWGNWATGRVGQPTGGDCNTDHPLSSKHTECQENCWCESPCDANAWQACSTSCGWGVQYNACGTPRSCIVNDPNSWSAWSACSATCDGGTETRINACGTSYQTQACNTQPCFTAWWQVKDSDVSTNGDLRSKVYPGNYFGLAGAGGFPGVPAYGGGTNLTPSNVSTKAWLANTTAIGAKVYNYAYFANLIPSDTSIAILSSNTLDQTAIDGNTTQSYGYYWYKFDGSVTGLDLNLNSNLSLGSKKVILLIDSANFLVKGKVNLTKGQGFFMAIVGKTAGGQCGFTEFYVHAVGADRSGILQRTRRRG